MDAREGSFRYTWGLDSFLPSKLRFPLAEVQKVMSARPPLSLRRWRLKVAVSVTYPSGPCPVLVQGDLQVLLLQESSRGDLHHFKSSVGEKGEIKDLKNTVQSMVFQPCSWKYWHPCGDGHTWHRQASKGIELVPHILCSAVKSQSGTFSALFIRTCQAKGKTFFKLTRLRNADVQFTDTHTEGKALIRQ